MKKDEPKKEGFAVTEKNGYADNLDGDKDTDPTTPSDTLSSVVEDAKTKQLSIKLPIHVHRQLKAKCALEGISSTQFVTRLVLENVEKKTQL